MRYLQVISFYIINIEHTMSLDMQPNIALNSAYITCICYKQPVKFNAIPLNTTKGRILQSISHDFYIEVCCRQHAYN